MNRNQRSGRAIVMVIASTLSACSYDWRLPKDAGRDSPDGNAETNHELDAGLDDPTVDSIPDMDSATDQERCDLSTPCKTGGDAAIPMFDSDATIATTDGATAATAALQLSCGVDFACARMASGVVLCWGNNFDGQLGVVDTALGAVPVVVPNLTDVVNVAAGYSSACAALEDGSVKCWGKLGTAATYQSPTTVAGVANAVEVAVGFDSACARLKTGSVACWGNNNTRQLGDGTTLQRTSPVPVAGVVGASAISMGPISGLNCAALSSGGAVCWGLTTNRAGLQEPSNPAIRFPDAKDIAVGLTATCAILATGKIACVGDGSYLGTGSATNGRVFDPAEVAGISAAEQVAAGPNHVCALLADGTVQCWGLNSGSTVTGGTLGSLSNEQVLLSPAPVTTLESVVSLSAGADFTCASTQSSDVFCWGMNDHHQLGGGTTSSSAARPVAVRLSAL